MESVVTYAVILLVSNFLLLNPIFGKIESKSFIHGIRMFSIKSLRILKSTLSTTTIVASWLYFVRREKKDLSIKIITENYRTYYSEDWNLDTCDLNTIFFAIFCQLWLIIMINHRPKIIISILMNCQCQNSKDNISDWKPLIYYINS